MKLWIITMFTKNKTHKSHQLRIFICDTSNQYIFQHIYPHLNINDVNNNVSLTLRKIPIIYKNKSGGLERFHAKYIYLKYSGIHFICYIHHINV